MKKRTPKPQPLTTQDVSDFFAKLGVALLIIVGAGLLMRGVIETSFDVFDWLDKPSEVELLRRDVQDLRRDEQFRHDTSNVFYYTTEEPPHVR